MTCCDIAFNGKVHRSITAKHRMVVAEHSDWEDILKGFFVSTLQLVPLFVADVFHFLPGFPGLFVASLFSASLR